MNLALPRVDAGERQAGRSAQAMRASRAWGMGKGNHTPGGGAGRSAVSATMRYS
jgi:hypothetical protein